jgi:hypothetical protein
VDRVGENFSRWMDDITIGVSSYTEGQRVLRDLDDLLQARGVRLNAGKTRILNSKQAAQYLFLEANRRLVALENSVESLKDSGDIVADQLKKDVRSEFRVAWKSQRVGSWPKVIARLVPLFSSLRDPFISRYVPYLLKLLPALRLETFNYYRSLGYSARRYRQIECYLLNDCIDDASLFAACKLLIDWDIHWRRHAAAVRLAGILADRSSIGLAGALWIIAKYGTEPEVVAVIRRTEARWRTNSFLARQVASILPRVQRMVEQRAWATAALRATGHSEVLAVLDNLEELRALQSLSRPERLYLLPSDGQHPYPLPKVLIGLEILQGGLGQPDRVDLVPRLEAMSGDRTYQRLFRALTPHPPGTMTVKRELRSSNASVV